MPPTILVTGGTKGIGRAIAEVFAEQGFDVCVSARTAADLQAMQTEWASRFPGQTLLVFRADLSQKADCQALAAFVQQAWPRLDVLVNNAGVFLPGAISEEADGTLESQIETNLYSAYHLTRALLPMMLPAKSGHIFNMCSIASFMAYPNGGSYSISKFALLGFTKVLRAEMLTKGIRVTAVMPGATWSDSWRGADFPTERLMPAEDIGRIIWGCYHLSGASVVEELIIRPQLGDL